MNTTQTTEPGIPSELMAELKRAAERAAKGVHDPEAMRESSERMDQISEQIRKKHGVLDIGAPAIRALREAE